MCQVCRHILTSVTPCGCSFMQVDEWLAFSPSLAAGPGLADAAAAVNDYLALRTYLVGHRLTLADVAVWGQLTGDTIPVSIIASQSGPGPLVRGDTPSGASLLMLTYLCCCWNQLLPWMHAPREGFCDCTPDFARIAGRACHTRRQRDQLPAYQPFSAAAGP